MEWSQINRLHQKHQNWLSLVSNYTLSGMSCSFTSMDPNRSITPKITTEATKTSPNRRNPINPPPAPSKRMLFGGFLTQNITKPSKKIQHCKVPAIHPAISSLHPICQVLLAGHRVGQVGVPEPGHRFAQVRHLVCQVQWRGAKGQGHTQGDEGPKESEGLQSTSQSGKRIISPFQGFYSFTNYPSETWALPPLISFPPWEKWPRRKQKGQHMQQQHFLQKAMATKYAVAALDKPMSTDTCRM